MKARLEVVFPDGKVISGPVQLLLPDQTIESVADELTAKITQREVFQFLGASGARYVVPKAAIRMVTVSEVDETGIEGSATAG
jgi:hypothetical protein